MIGFFSENYQKNIIPVLASAGSVTALLLGSKSVSKVVRTLETDFMKNAVNLFLYCNILIID